MIRTLLLAVTTLLLAGSGCDSGPKLVHISGQVLVDGQPLRHGFVTIAPEGHRAALAKLDSEGRFTMTTGPDKDGDGVALGTHKVAVNSIEHLGPGSQKWHAPKKYNDLQTSGLTVTIDKAQSDLVLNLTWDGGKPFIERSGKE
ncbi:hypothetical protein BH11PLA2_BH11PLA2_10390 [soil metagenome]